MANTRITQALARIDAAIERIESAPPHAGADPAADQPGLAALAVRHESLRDSVSGSLAELDALIEGLER